MTSTPAPRPALDALPTYRPGKSAEVAMDEHAIDSAIKLASNENPFAPLPSVVDAIAEAAATGMNRYPDHRATAVRAALAERAGLDESWLTVGCGSVGLLQQLMLTYVDPGDEVLYGWRSFEAYPIYTTTVSGVSVQVPNRFEALDMEAIAKAVSERTRLVLVTSPNNPTGTAIRAEELNVLLAAVPEGCLVVLDEAYHEYVTGLHVPDALAVLRDHPNFAVLRTFSKAYGLASLRIGYLFAHPGVITAVDKTLIPFAVNGMAQAAALASLAADDELAARVNDTIAERERVAGAIRSMGFGVPDAQANFVWLPAGELAAPLTLRLEQLGIVTRPFPGEGLRVTVGDAVEGERFLDAFRVAAAELDLAATWLLPVGDDARRVQGYIERIDAAHERLVADAVRPHHGLTAPDADGAEQWDAGQVGAHLAEITGYWLGQLELLIDVGSDEPVAFGRPLTEAGRVDAIAAGRGRPVADQLATTRRNLDRLRAYLPGLSTTDWTRQGRHAALGDIDVAGQLEAFHIGHVEQHLDQLDALAAAG